MRERNRESRATGVDRLAHAQLVLGVQVREEQADGNGDAVAVAVQFDLIERLVERLNVDRHEHVAGLVHPLRDPEAVAPADEGRRLAPVEVVVVLAVDALDVRDVLEALGRQVEHPGAAAGEDGVDADRRSDDHRFDLARIDRCLPQHRGDGRDGVAGIGRHLREERAAVVVDRDQVGERPAGVDAHPDPHQRNVRPPSIRMVWPVTKALSREARKTSRPTRSSGCS